MSDPIGRRNDPKVMTTIAGCPVGDNRRGFAVKFYTKEGNWDMAGNNNIVSSINPLLVEIQKRQSSHFLKADPAYGNGVADGLGMKLQAL